MTKSWTTSAGSHKHPGMNELTIRTARRDHFVDITADVQRIVTETGVRDGICTVLS